MSLTRQRKDFVQKIKDRHVIRIHLARNKGCNNGRWLYRNPANSDVERKNAPVTERPRVKKGPDIAGLR